MPIINRDEARTAGLKWFFTGEPCRQGHVAQRQVSNNSCRVCALERFRRWYKERGYRTAAKRREEWRARNPERAKEVQKAWHRAHPEGQKIRHRRWYLANQARADAQHKRWGERNPGKLNALAAKRRADVLLRTPAWANHAAIDAIYIEGRRRRDAGETVDVDHFYPLRGRLVSGLHVHENLQIIDSSLNKRKSHHLIGD